MSEISLTHIPYRSALIVGAGPGIGASVGRALVRAGLNVGLAARDIDRLTPLATEIGAKAYAVDAADPASVERVFAQADGDLGPPEVVVYNASARVRGRIAELDPEAVRRAIEVSALGGFLAVRQAAIRMVPKGHGAILLTGASASVKGYPLSSSFAMGKFALRGLAQSAARELAPQGVHVAHFVIDGGVRGASRPDPADRPDSTLDPDGVAQTYLAVLAQPRNAWTWEVELRPWVETF
jgi:NAD(P)-dependent dehydrogenase (short-subunit alcohol dehydrogenase family)